MNAVLDFQKGLTPLHLAAENDHSLIVELFLKAQADSNPMTMVDEVGMYSFWLDS